MSEFNEAALLEITDMLTTATENVEKVYGAGHSKGYQTGYTVGHQDGDESYYNQGYDAGKQAEYDAFWDGKQAGGGYKDYTSAFGGRWSAEIFKPKYDIEPSYANYMFYANGLNIDLVEHLEKIGRKLDFSKCKGQISCFTASKFTHLGNVSATGGFASVFQNCKELVTIDEWGHAEGGDITDTLTNTFASCEALENITIKGRIANTIYFHWSKKLTRASIESIVNALSDNVSGKTLQLSKVAVDEAFMVYNGPLPEEDPNGYDNPDNWIIGSVSGEWMELCYIHSNWTITLI